MLKEFNEMLEKQNSAEIEIIESCSKEYLKKNNIKYEAN